MSPEQPPRPPLSLSSADSSSLLVQIATTLWGAYGTDGMNGKVQEHSRQLGELQGRIEELSGQLERRLTGIYRLIATLTVTILVSAIGIIATLALTTGGTP